MKDYHDLIEESRQYFNGIEKWGKYKANEYGCSEVIPFLLLEGMIERYIDNIGK